MINMTVVNLQEVFSQTCEGMYDGWLYLPQGPWTLVTEGIFLDQSVDAHPDEPFPPKILEPLQLKATLDAAGIEDVISYARQQREPCLLDDMLRSFVFYLENDAFLLFDGNED